MNTSSAAGLPSEEAQQRHSTQIPGATGSRTLGVSAVLAAATLLVLAAGAYLLWGRTGPSSAADPSGAASVNDALIAQKDRPSEPPAANVNNNVARIDSANANLEARNYRAALADAEAVLQTAPGDARASRVREVARETLARFDDGIARAGAALAAGNLDAAEQALAAARAIDPSAPAVADLTAQLLARLKSRGNSDIQTGASAPPARPGPAVAAPRRPEAADPRAAARPNSRGKPDGALLPPPPAAAERTQAALPPRPSTPPPPGASPNGGVSSNPAPSSPPPAAAGAPPVAATPTTSPPTSSVGQGQPAAASQAPGPKTDAAAQKVDAPVAAKAEPPAAKVEPPPAPASAAAPPTAAARRETDPNERGAAPAPKGNGREGTTQDTEDDDAAIRRVINTYARAIETKNLALFRSVKPNLSAEEQRRIEESFRNVSSQRIAVTILSVTRQAREASVRLRRRDEIEAGGRRQVNESQQTVILDRVGSSWVIREIGR